MWKQYLPKSNFPEMCFPLILLRVNPVLYVVIKIQSELEL